MTDPVIDMLAAWRGEIQAALDEALDQRAALAEELRAAELHDANAQAAVDALKEVNTRLAKAIGAPNPLASILGAYLADARSSLPKLQAPLLRAKADTLNERIEDLTQAIAQANAAIAGHDWAQPRATLLPAVTIELAPDLLDDEEFSMVTFPRGRRGSRPELAAVAP